jgi:glycosyltransferase involved in cell wall biosynthesis
MNQKPELSVIIPCYNSEKTLEEAVLSVLNDDIGYSYEIIMVDDGSTDNTKRIIRSFVSKYENVRAVYHNVNKGGGATRNTAVQNASADLIFCLDSDDMIGKGSLKKMIDFQKENNLDGVGVAKSIKFKGKDLNDIAFINEFGYVNEHIPFQSLFEGDTCSLYSVFLHTKKSFESINGYPTAHGFDTQGFAFRFLANGFKASTCPDTTYHHRINFHRSYYLREYDSGKVNHNWRMVYEEYLFLFDDETKNTILTFDYNNPNLFLNSILIGKKILIPDYQKYIAPGSKEIFLQTLKDKGQLTVFDNYWLGVYAEEKADMKAALDSYTELLKNGFAPPLVAFKGVNTLSKISSISFDELVDRAKKFNQYALQGHRISLFRRIVRKLIRTIKK